MRSEEPVSVGLAGGLTVWALEVGEVLILEFEGEISRKKGGKPSLCEYIDDELTRGKKNFVFSFRNLRFMDEYGIGEILRSYTSIRGLGGKLKWACLPKKMLTLFDICWISLPWRIRPQEDSLHKTVEEALESFAAESSSE